MTTKRRIKKEIDYFVSDLILDCFTYANLSDSSKDEGAVTLVSETLSLRNKLRDQANHPEKRAESVSVKAFYDNLAKELITGVDNGYDKLGQLAGKKDK